MQIAAGALARALKILVRLAPKKSTMPILEHVSFVPAQGGIALTATDLTTEARVVLPAEAPFPTVLPARDLLGFVKTLDLDAMLEFERHDKLVRVMAAGSTLELPCLPARDFPNPIAHASAVDAVATTDGDGFLDALDWALLAVGHDPTRPQLTGVLLEGDRIVAVDGHRLHVATVPMQDCPRALVPEAAAAFASRALRGSPFAIEVGKGTVRLSSATWTITTKQVDAKFPTYEQVIPVVERAAFEMKVDPTILASALRRVARPGRTRAEHPVRIRANGAIAIESMAADTRIATSVDVFESTHEGEDHVVGFNGRYIAEAIAHGSEAATLSFYGSEDPLRIDMDERVAVVMPMRI